MGLIADLDNARQSGRFGELAYWEWPELRALLVDAEAALTVETEHRKSRATALGMDVLARLRSALDQKDEQ
jgi:hypothetical protein